MSVGGLCVCRSTAATSTLVAPSLDGRTSGRLALTDEVLLCAVGRTGRAPRIGGQGRASVLSMSCRPAVYPDRTTRVRTTLMREVHDAPTGEVTSAGRRPMRRLTSRRSTGSGVYHDVRDYVRSCVSCAQNKANQLHGLGLPPSAANPGEALGDHLAWTS